MNLVLLEKKLEQTAAEYSLAATKHVTTQAGASYSVIDKATGKPPLGLVLKRNDDDLEIFVDGESVASIDGFYSVEGEAFYTINDNSLTTSELQAGTSGAGSENGIVWQAEASDNTVAWLAGGGALGGLAAAGGGGSAAAVSSVSSYLVTLAVAAGPFQTEVKIDLFDKDGNLLASKIHDLSSGSVQFTIDNGYVGPVLARVSDLNGTEGDYLDETTNTLINLGQPMRAMAVADGGANVTLSITPLTELAVRKAGVSEASLASSPLTEANVAINEAIGVLFGVDDITAPVTTVVDANYNAGDGLSSAELYGNVLAMLSGVDSQSGSMDATLEQLEAGVNTKGDGELALSQAAVELLSRGADEFEAGANGDKAVLNDVLIKPPVIEAAGSGINVAESSAGVAVKISGAVVGDEVVIFWGDQTHTSTVQAADINAAGAVTITVPADIINAAGGGQVTVRSQINTADQSPALLINIDNTAPSIDSSTTAAAINENSDAGQIIYTATSNDNAATFSLKGSGDDSLFTIDSATGAVTLIGRPDYESQPDYSFTVVATDTAGNRSEQVVGFSINNLDEATFTSGDSAGSIDENGVEGQLVYTARSSDSSASYSLKGTGDDGLFSIDSATGAVTLIGRADYETQSSYSFTVVATDAANNRSEQVVSLEISDLNETALTSGGTATSIDENSGNGQLVYTATSSDSSAVYSLNPTGDYVLFNIDSSTGAVTLKANPDYEEKSNYSFTVVATDAANNSSEQTVSLSISDVNEVPAVVLTSGANATAIDENTSAGQIVYTATSDNSDVSYSLKDTGDSTLFSIDSATGAVTLTGAPNYETKPSYSFTVLATGFSNSNGVQAVSLDINNLDESNPTITSSASVAVDENSGAAQVIYTAAASDSDDISGGVTYSLKAVDDSASFSIDANSGEVTLTGDPDHETKSSYDFTVIATDAADNSSEQAVSLAINNLDEVDPTITSNASATAINENSGAGQVIYTAAATDGGDISGGVSYSLKGTGDAGAFSTDANTGAVTLTGDPDFETKPSYNFTVVVTDAAGNSAEQAVNLAINDLSDETPPVVTAVSIPDAAMAIGDTVTVTLTVDDDAGDIYTNITGTVGGFALSSLARTGSTTYTAEFTVGSGGLDVVAGDDISVNLSIDDSVGNTSGAYTTAISQASDAIDVNAPVITISAIDAAAMNVGDVVTVTLTVEDDGGDIYTNLSGTVGGFALSNLMRISNTSYSAQFTVAEGGADVMAGSDIPVNFSLDDSAGNTSSAYTTAISQGGDGIDASTPSNAFTGASYDAAANTITLTGTAMNSLLSSGETATTGLKANFDWSKFRWDINGDGATTADVSFILADIESALATDDTTLSIKLTNTKGTALEATTDYDALDANDTVDIGSGFSGDTAGNVQSGSTFEGPSYSDASIVVFDLIHGVSSGHSGRTFDAGTTYTLYVLLSNVGIAPVTVPTAGAAVGASWGVWSDVTNLGPDDTVVIVGDGGLVQGTQGAVQGGLGTLGGGRIMKVGAGTGYVLQWLGNGNVYGANGGNFDIWDGTVVGVGTGPAGADHYIQMMPAGLLTSQGLI